MPELLYSRSAHVQVAYDQHLLPPYQEGGRASIIEKSRYRLDISSGFNILAVHSDQNTGSSDGAVLQDREDFGIDIELHWTFIALMLITLLLSTYRSC